MSAFGSARWNKYERIAGACPADKAKQNSSKLTKKAP